PHLMVSTSMVYGCIIDVFNTEDISAECAGRELALRPAGSALPQRAIIYLNKDGARPIDRAFVLVRACGGGGDVHFCEYSAIEGHCIPTSGEKSGFLDVFYE
ncbi:hypothetical protein, partial [Collinsella aerofaciens]|uniref:hypothetical protein n=1 Tax=Collinsella aerofaciens TaxID=74426 RepID=UPI0034A2971C